MNCKTIKYIEGGSTAWGVRKRTKINKTKGEILCALLVYYELENTINSILVYLRCPHPNPLCAKKSQKKKKKKKKKEKKRKKRIESPEYEVFCM